VKQGLGCLVSAIEGHYGKPESSENLYIKLHTIIDFAIRNEDVDVKKMYDKSCKKVERLQTEKGIVFGEKTDCGYDEQANSKAWERFCTPTLHLRR
jgi:hypothetical protein